MERQLKKLLDKKDEVDRQIIALIKSGQLKICITTIPVFAKKEKINE